MTKHLWLTGLNPAAFTPLKADGSLNLDAVPALVEHLLRDGVSGLYVCGSTGEGVSLTREERMAVAEAYTAAAARRIPVVVQVGHNSLREARLLAEHAQKIGADAVSATPPMYFKPANTEAVVACLTEVAAGANHSCALLQTGAVECWGFNVLGELGNGTTATSLVPVPVKGVTNATAIRAGGENTCALLADSTVVCWGYNVDGQLGDGTPAFSNVPAYVVGL